MIAEHCFFCGHRIEGDIDRKCSGCGAYRETAPDKRVHARCPRCHDVRLSPFALGPVALHVCGRCKGSFLPAAEWDALLETFAGEHLPDVLLPDETGPGSAPLQPYRDVMVEQAGTRATDDLAQPVRCPTCEDDMERLEFAGISGITIDVCRSHGVWLDAGEIEAVIETTQERPSRAAPREQAAVRPAEETREPAARRATESVLAEALDESCKYI